MFLDIWNKVMKMKEWKHECTEQWHLETSFKQPCPRWSLQLPTSFTETSSCGDLDREKEVEMHFIDRRPGPCHQYSLHCPYWHFRHLQIRRKFQCLAFLEFWILVKGRQKLFIICNWHMFEYLQIHLQLRISWAEALDSQQASSEQILL